MCKIKIGDQVFVKENGVVGTVVGREAIALEDKKVRVEYVVKTGAGFENYKSFTRKEIAKTPKALTDVPEKTVYPRIYNYEHKCADGRILVLTGVVDTYYDDITSFETYGSSRLVEVNKVKRKVLFIGYSICHPDDSNNKEIGASIALRRAYDKPLAIFESPFTGEFREDFVTVILKAKAQFVEENNDRFIERDKK